MIKFAHYNFNVLDLDRSLKFYDEALGLKVMRDMTRPDGAFRIVYVGNEHSEFLLELTWLADRTEPYDLGEEEVHLAFATDEFEEYKKKHQDMGIICFENHDMGIYFIEDPDGYWIEIVPQR